MWETEEGHEPKQDESDNENVSSDLHTELSKLARTYGFRDVTALRRESYPHKGNNLFIAEMKLTGLKHWWHGGGNGMAITAKALVFDMRELLEKKGFTVTNTRQHYLS